jgi:methionine synthase II (cobalamin-independent)
MLNPLETTTIGSFPKPSFVPVRDWFDLAREKGAMDTIETTLQYNLDIQKKQRHP